jgi:LPS-assembly protein
LDSQTLSAAALISVLTVVAVSSGRAVAAPVGQSMALCRSHLSYVAPPTVPEVTGNHHATRIWADSVAVEHQRLFRFQGDVQVSRDDQTVSADTATYDKDTGRLDAAGDVHMAQGGFAAQGAAGFFDMDNDSGELNDAKYQYDVNHSHGMARRIIIENSDVSHLKDATLTTCDPGDEVWYFKSSDVKLDKGTGWGRALNIVFHVKDIPVFYFPYISFPISDKRKSGFLIPSFESSSRSGLIFDIPYYLNIAPNLDATVTPHFMTDRGTQLEGELRYLTRGSHGIMNLQYLPGDRIYGRDRAQVSYQNDTAFSSGVNADVDINFVSDKDYLDDFSNSLSAGSLYYLENRLDLSYHRGDLSATGLLEAYQTVDRSVSPLSRPYQQLPRFNVGYDPLITGAWFDQEYGLNADFVRFVREISVTGDRLDLRPSVSLPVRREAGYVIPRLTLRSTFYRLRDQGAGGDSDITRTLPVASVDSGIFLERDVDWGAHHWLQTLEPRAFYLYIPYRDQSQIPVFDSGQPDLNMSQLFSDNRFSGSDRIGDANQITLGLTSRFLQRDTGQELFRAGVGQILFFRDRTVTLPGQAVERGDTSDVVGEAGLTLGDGVTATGDLIWDRDTHDLNKGTVELHYRRDGSHIINVGYRYIRQQTLRQTDISAVWPIYGYWRFVGRWNYSVQDSRTLESVAGLEYSSCCWGVRAVWRQYVTDISGTANRSIMFQVVLKGMTNLGAPVEAELERSILGYEAMP